MQTAGPLPGFHPIGLAQDFTIKIGSDRRGPTLVDTGQLGKIQYREFLSGVKQLARERGIVNGGGWQPSHPEHYEFGTSIPEKVLVERTLTGRNPITNAPSNWAKTRGVPDTLSTKTESMAR